MTNSVELKSALTSLSIARDFLEDSLSGAGVSEEDIFDIALAADEWLSNIILHSYTPGQEGNIEIHLHLKDCECVVTFRDRGEKFNFYATKSPNIEECMRAGKSSGLGIYLIRNLTDKVEYSNSPQGNQLTITKKIERRKK